LDALSQQIFDSKTIIFLHTANTDHKCQVFVC